MPLSTQRSLQSRGYKRPTRRKRFAVSLEERKLEIPTTTTNNTLELQSSIPLLRQRLQRASKAPHLHSSMSLRLQRIARAPNLCASSTSLHLHHASRAPDLQHINVHKPAAHPQSSDASVSPPPPPRTYTCSTPPELPISIPLVSTSTRLQRISRARYLYASYTRSTPPELQIS